MQIAVVGQIRAGSVRKVRSGCEFVDCVGFCGVGVVGCWGAGGLWDLHGDVWHLPYPCAAGGGGEIGAERGGAGRRRLDFPALFRFKKVLKSLIVAFEEKARG